jgi:hypothetical protein
LEVDQRYNCKTLNFKSTEGKCRETLEDIIIVSNFLNRIPMIQEIARIDK